MSPRFVRLGLAFSVLCSPALRAEDAGADAKVPAYTLKNKSAFAAPTEDQRAPFWPIGWTKRKPMQAATTAAPTRVAEVPKVSLDPRNFKVTSILVGNPSLAIINGRTYSEGEFLRVPRAALPAGATSAAPVPRVRVYRINDGSVALQNQDQVLTVALQRPELAQRKTEEQLLVEDRP